jgi:hypothetical protein
MCRGWGIAILLLVFGMSVCARCGTTTNPSPTTANSTQELEKFWSDFRAAALGDEPGKAAKFTQFPFEVRGELDSDPTRRVGPKEFAKVFEELLSRDAGQQADAESMRELIRRTEKLDARQISEAGDEANVGILSFQKTKRGWRLVRAHAAPAAAKKEK